MGDTVKLGRILGVEVGVNWSVLVVFVLIAWGLAGTVLPQEEPGHSHAVYWTAALITATLFFLCLLAHELSHAVVARRNGLTVSGITLWLLGGMTRLDGDMPSASAELRVAGIGPLVSLLLGALFTGFALTLRTAGAPGPIVASAAWLGAINILLAVFNALPAAPLDGGRLLRAFVWWRTGDRNRSALAAAAAGRFLGWLFIGGGTVLLFLTGSIEGFWFALTGWFLLVSATAESRQTRIHTLLSGIRARQIMTPDPEPVAASLTVERFLEDPSHHRHSAFPLTVGDPTPIGLITLDRIRRIPPAAREDIRLREIMYPLDQLVVAAPDDPAEALIPRLTTAPAHHALILDDGRLVGMVTPSDISRAMQWASVRSRASGPGGPVP
ncbi:Zn-dependent protease/CBS domain-containing protein [Catenulispora sp. GP43]|uniref:site-2 protease family protein n=1 Tax=Catenulispora sp. GP43 TaxID=3156263 RepID=UPI0035173F9F